MHLEASSGAPPTSTLFPQHHCASCKLRELCMPVGLSIDEMHLIDDMVVDRRKVARGAHLFRQGDAFHSLYAIRVGMFKTCVSTPAGHEQVTGFQMAGDIVGLDGIAQDRHACDAVALESAEVCVIPFVGMEALSLQMAALQRHVHRLMSREIVREHGVMLLLGSMRADERVAAFLVNLFERLEARGYSGFELVLRMTREEIGSYLGLTLETVSRTFSRFADEHLIDIKHRQVRLLDPAALLRLANLPTVQ
jgi:CRP/FNR family transcriptional regulator